VPPPSKQVSGRFFKIIFGDSLSPPYGYFCIADFEWRVEITADFRQFLINFRGGSSMIETGSEIVRYLDTLLYSPEPEGAGRLKEPTLLECSLFS